MSSNRQFDMSISNRLQRGESFIFTAGPSTTQLHLKVLDHKTLGKDKTLGEADVDVCPFFLDRR